MTAHADILDQPESLAASFWTSVVMHVVIFVVLIAYGAVLNRPHEHWGDKNGGGMGAISVGTVSQIPLPGRTGMENPVANPTESQVPTAPPKTKAAKPAAKEKPAEDAIALKSKNSHKSREEAATPNKFREKQRDEANQLYSRNGQAAVSPLFGQSGSGGVGMGANTPFGTQLGWYASAMQTKVAQNWKTDDIPPSVRSAPQVIVTFSIRRDGSIGGVPQIKQSSGIPALDRSAQRAIVDSNPFAPIPAQFPRNQAEIELTFELRR